MACHLTLVTGARLCSFQKEQVIEQLAGKTLTKGLGNKLMANFTRLMSYAFGKKSSEAKTPEKKPSALKREMGSPGAPAQEFDGEYEGYVPEGKFVSIASYVRSYVYAFAERLHSLWEGVSDLANQPFIPRKAPMIFRWHSNAAWNPREWIAKRMNMRQGSSYWHEPELMAKVKKFADPLIEKRRWQPQKAKDSSR